MIFLHSISYRFRQPNFRLGDFEGWIVTCGDCPSHGHGSL